MPTVVCAEPPEPLKLKDLIRVVDGLEDPIFFVYKGDCGSVQHWWREISDAQKKWNAKRSTTTRGDFPTADLQSWWKTARVTSGAYIVFGGEKFDANR